MHTTSSSNPGLAISDLENPLGNGANVLAEALATGNPGACYTQDSSDTQTGAVAGPVEAGVNTRFGIYEGSFKNARSTAVIAPPERAFRHKRKRDRTPARAMNP